MTNTIKTAVAALALVATPALVSAQSLAVSLSATFADNNSAVSDIDLTNNTADVASPTSLSVAAATGTNAAASTAGATLTGLGGVTFANSGGGDVTSSEQALSVASEDYTATVSFDAPM